MILTPQHRRFLLTIARESIASVHDGRMYEPDPAQLDETLRRPAGAFVTLTRDGHLRGCIGSIHAVEPLFQAVSKSAVNAAFRDPRFHPVSKDELAQLALEISVMGPIERVTSIDEIVCGRDGLIISRARYAGLLLPQVATEYGWDTETFLQHTCMKAGLPPDAWRSPETRIEKFAAEVFGELSL